MKALVLALMFVATAAQADYPGCSNSIKPGVSTKTFVVNCMKFDAIAVKKPDYYRQTVTKYSTLETVGFGKTTFYFRNGILDSYVK